MTLDKIFFERFSSFGEKPAFIFHDQEFSYAQLLSQIAQIEKTLNHLPPRSVVAIESQDSPLGYAALLAVLKNHIAVPMLSSLIENVRHVQAEIAQAEWLLKIENGEIAIESLKRNATHPLYENLKSGLVLFSSGSTGEPKGIVHDFHKLALKFEKQKPPQRLLQFLLFDHMGGLNTAFSALSTGGCLVLSEKKDPVSITDAIEKHNIEILPTTPSFLQWLLLSHQIDRKNLSSLKLVSYGTEPMPSSTLKLLREKLPHVSFKQTYGLSEIGVVATQSRSDNSTWIRLRDDIRIQNGLLEIRAATPMLGYLNAESPFTEDGWFRTFDAVEVDGEWVHILGRQTDLMNVAGLKVSPLEVENVLLRMPEVSHVTVYGESNPLLGTIIKAQVSLREPLPLTDFRTRMRIFCQGKLEACKIPQAVEIVDSSMSHPRIKNARFHVV